MNTNTRFSQAMSQRKAGLLLSFGLPALLMAIPLICIGRGGDRGAAPRAVAAPRAPAAPPRAAAPRAPEAARPVVVDRSSHGSIRHVDTHVVQRPVEVRPEIRRPAEVRPAPQHVIEPRHDVIVHRDVEVDVHRPRFWHDFAFGRRLAALPLGYFSLQLGGVPYYYYDGIYYQPAGGGYQEVYPPVGAAVPEPPDGSIEVDAGGLTYYYAGGAFYLVQADGTYAIAPTPIGVVVPELPPGAVQVSLNGGIAYQFNGIYYEPVFVNGVTQYETIMP